MNCHKPVHDISTCMNYVCDKDEPGDYLQTLLIATEISKTDDRITISWHNVVAMRSKIATKSTKYTSPVHFDT